jgi:hypothetical protein
MKIQTKLVALGALGAAAYGVARALRHRSSTSDVDARFDASDVDIDVEEIIVATEDDQGDINLDIVSRVTG